MSSVRIDEPAPSWERPLRPWRAASALLAMPQGILVIAGFVLLLRDDSNKSRALLAIGAAAALEGLRWGVEREALRRHPGIDLDELYRRAPLRQSDRRVVDSNLVLVPLGAVAFVTVLVSSFGFSLAEAFLLVLCVGITWVAPLCRVRRRNSWLAMSRLPSRPLRGAPLEPEPKRPVFERARSSTILRWIALTWLAVSVVVLVLVAIAGFGPNDLVLLAIVWTILILFWIGVWSSTRFSDWP
jgi:hypothetical protein